MSRQPTRQLSLQQPKRGHQQQRVQIRRQKSADDRTHEVNPLMYSITDQPSSRSRREKSNWCNNADRPKVRIAWSSTADDKVEVIASRIGTAGKVRGNNGSASGSSSIIGTDKATILYSRQELAERLRLAWKQREANKSNIDIFLAHGTTADESRCESRLSSSSCELTKTIDEKESNISFTIPPALSTATSSDETKENVEKESKIVDARTKRASFQSGTNLAFTGAAVKNSFVSPIIKDTTCEKVEKCDKKDRTTGLIDGKTKRTNSAPPLPRRGISTNSSTVRPKVSIIIDTPKIGKSKDSNAVKDIKIERKDCGSIKDHAIVSPDEAWMFKTSSPTGQLAVDKPKSSTKKRARSGKRRVDDTGKKSDLTKSNPDVVTMVSLVSDADSDSENESNSPGDDKLVRQLRSNLPTTPIIKSCSPLMMNSSLSVSTSALDTLVPRRVLKSVSFQQDSIDGELHLRPRTAADKGTFPHEGPSKMMLQQAQIQQIIRGTTSSTTPSSAEMVDIKNAWHPEISCTTVDVTMIPSPRGPLNYWKNSDEESPTLLTDREKRCLVVPLGDTRDKKRKLLLQRAKTVSTRSLLCEDNQTTLQIETKESSTAVMPSEKHNETLSSIHRSGAAAVSLQTSITKQLMRGSSFQESSSIEIETIDIDVESMEPNLRTTKEKECWHLYRRMCDKGVCVSFDTVLRGMLTPTEYRLRRREVT